MPNNPNKKKIHRPVGRPPLWKSPKELQDKIDEYYAYCEEKDKPLTIAGLAYYVGTDRQTIYNYRYKDEFNDILKKARDLIMMRLEEILIVKGGSGPIFLSKQYGYVDKQEIDNNISGNLSYENKLKDIQGEKL